MKNKQFISTSQLKAIINKGHIRGVLNLTETGANAQCLIKLQDLLERSRSFHTLEMYGNNALGDEKGVLALQALVDQVSSITKLKLEFNHISDDSVQCLCEWLKCNKTVKALDLYGNIKIGDQGAIHLASLLEGDCSLEYLGLFQCGIGMMGARAIFNAISKGNRTIKHVNLYNNDIDEEFLEALESLLLRNAGNHVAEIQALPETKIDDKNNQTKYPQRQSDPWFEYISKSTSVIEWNEEREQLIAQLDKLILERQQHLTQINKEYITANDDHDELSLDAIEMDEPLPSPTKDQVKSPTWKSIYLNRSY
jgi:hypothetical protein